MIKTNIIQSSLFFLFHVCRWVRSNCWQLIAESSTFWWWCCPWCLATCFAGCPTASWPWWPPSVGRDWSPLWPAWCPLSWPSSAPSSTQSSMRSSTTRWALWAGRRWTMFVPFLAWGLDCSWRRGWISSAVIYRNSAAPLSKQQTSEQLSYDQQSF